MSVRLIYLLVALVIFAIEVCIALFVHDAFIRPYIGDVLAVVLVYCALRAVTPMSLWPAIAATLSVALAIELAQLLNLLDMIGLRSNRIAATVLGGSFDWLDLVAYVAGAVAVVAVEQVRPKR
jgi:hypothetical protein